MSRQHSLHKFGLFGLKVALHFYKAAWLEDGAREQTGKMMKGC